MTKLEDSHVMLILSLAVRLCASLGHIHKTFYLLTINGQNKFAFSLARLFSLA